MPPSRPPQNAKRRRAMGTTGRGWVRRRCEGRFFPHFLRVRGLDGGGGGGDEILVFVTQGEVEDGRDAVLLELKPRGGDEGDEGPYGSGSSDLHSVVRAVLSEEAELHGGLELGLDKLRSAAAAPPALLSQPSNSGWGGGDEGAAAAAAPSSSFAAIQQWGRREHPGGLRSVLGVSQAAAQPGPAHSLGHLG